MSEAHECPTCGDEFDTENGMKVHHVRTHGESIAGVPIDCEQCGTQFRCCRSVAGERRFCSDECQNEWQSKAFRGEDNPNYSNDGLVVSCNNCGETKLTYDKRNYTNRFCSHNCHNEWRSENQVGKDHHQWNQIEHTCSQCDEQYLTHPHKTGETRFCSAKCRDEWVSENQSGEENPNYSGGTFPYGEGWTERKKRKVRIRDQARCQECGRTEPEHLEEFGRKHTVHHIQKARSIDSPEVRNGMDNLVTLCETKGCHKKWEKMAPLRPMVD